MTTTPEVGRNETFLLLASLGVGVAVGVLAPGPWWAKVLACIAATVLILVLVARFHRQLGRLVLFVLFAADPHWGGATARPETVNIRVGWTAWGQLIQGGADPESLDVSRIVVEDERGTPHVTNVMPASTSDEELRAKLKATVKGANVPLISARAMRGLIEVERWTPSFGARVVLAWQATARSDLD